MYDLKNMEAWEAVQAAIEASGLTRKELASRLGVPLHTVNRYCSREDAYEPSISMVRRLCIVTGNAVLISWVEAKLDRSGEDIPSPQSRAQVLTAIARAVAALGDASRLLADTEECGITPASAREIRSALLDVVGESRLGMGMLQHIAEHRGVDTCQPLASLAPMSATRPWWKLWG